MTEPTHVRGVNRRPNTKPQAGVMRENRESWVDMPAFQAVTFYGHSQDWLEWKEEQDEAFAIDPDAPPVRTVFRFAGTRRPLYFKLTSMTVLELDAFKSFLDHAFELARPICEHLDAKAVQAYENEGDDSFARLYRPVPRFFIREQLQQEHRQGLQERPPRLVDGASLPASSGVLRSDDGGHGSNDPDPEPSDGGEGSGGISPDDRDGGQHP